MSSAMVCLFGSFDSLGLASALRKGSGAIAPFSSRGAPNAPKLLFVPNLLLDVAHDTKVATMFTSPVIIKSEVE